MYDLRIVQTMILEGIKQRLINNGAPYNVVLGMEDEENRKNNNECYAIQITKVQNTQTLGAWECLRVEGVVSRHSYDRYGALIRPVTLFDRFIEYMKETSDYKASLSLEFADEMDIETKNGDDCTHNYLTVGFVAMVGFEYLNKDDDLEDVEIVKYESKDIRYIIDGQE